MGRPRKNFDAAIAMYDSGASIGDVAEAFNVTRQSMWQALALRGVRFRPQKRYGKDNTFHRDGTTSGKKQARWLMQRATDSGRIERGSSCEQCGSSYRVEGHHDDYNKPFVVRWLCKHCHFAWHKSNKAIPRHG